MLQFKQELDQVEKNSLRNQISFHETPETFFFDLQVYRFTGSFKQMHLAYKSHWEGYIPPKAAFPDKTISPGCYAKEWTLWHAVKINHKN